MIILLIGAAQAVPPAADDTASLAFGEAATRARAVADSLDDATWTLHQQVWVGGKLDPDTRMEVKWRASDDGLYMRWSGDVNTGRELLWVPGWNDDRMRVRVGRWVPNIDLALDSRLATRNQRHSLKEASIVFTVDNIVDGAIRVRDSAVLTPDVTDLGTRSVEGDDAHCFLTVTDKATDPELYSYKSEICFADRTGLPVFVENWDHEDGALRMVERYTFASLVVNPGLAASEFTPDHEGYGF